MSTITNIGVIGAGRIGRLHARNIATRVPNARLTAIADIRIAAAEDLANQLNVTLATNATDELINSDNVDAIVIACATNAHARIIQQAAAAGKHVLCEKPLATDLAEIDAAIEAAAQAYIKLQIGFNRRFDVNVQRVRLAVISDEIGHPQLIHIISRDPAPPSIEYLRGSGGIFMDMTIHDFDMARYLVGSEVVELYVNGAVLVDERIGEFGDIDTAITSLRFENGAIGMIDNCRRAAYGYDQRIEILGTKGSVRTQNVPPNNTIISDANGIRSELPLHFFLERYDQSFVDEMSAFVQAIQNDTEPLVTGADGKAPVLMALAAIRSLELHRPVRVDEVTQNL